MIPYDQRQEHFNDPDLESRYNQAITSNGLNSLQFRTIQLLLEPINYFTLLDIGCQRGQLTHAIIEPDPELFKIVIPFQNVYALDVSPRAVAIGKTLYPDFNWHCGDIVDYHPPRKIDLVLALNVWYYLSAEEQTQVIQKLNQEILSSVGYFLISFGINNFTKANIDPENILAAIDAELELVCQARTYEKIPAYPIDPNAHSHLDQWYWTALFRTRG
jgi:SAM-dependent methyltransferase